MSAAAGVGDTVAAAITAAKVQASVLVRGPAVSRDGEESMAGTSGVVGGGGSDGLSRRRHRGGPVGVRPYRV
ncbi:hypothetical protein GCM10027590_45060 [Nocardiopsis nanhaiensis]